MGLFSQIFGNDRPDGLFRSEMQHLTNKVDQVGKNQDRILSLRESGIGAQATKKLRVYFITNTETKAKRLVSELMRMEYECEWTSPHEKNGDYLIEGVTDELQMSDESIAEWTEFMCDLAAVQDCEFEHWTP